MARISTHILDLSRGLPAAQVRVELYRLEGSHRHLVAATVTNADGRTAEPLFSADPLPAATFELVFHAGEYFRALAVPTFLEEVPLRFRVDPAAGSYHVPLLLSPFGYSTYRGS